MQPIRSLIAAILLAACAAPAAAQTIKTLGFNLTNNTVVGPTNTNALVFTNPVSFAGQIQAVTGTAAIPSVRVSTNNAGIYYGSAIGIGGFVGIARESNSIVRFATNRAIFDQPIDFLSETNVAATQTRTNLGLGATWLTNTNVTNFRTAVGLGATNDVVFNRVDTSDGVALTGYGVIGGGFNGQIDFEENELFTGDGDWKFEGSGIEGAGAIAFNNTTNAATTRTNLGLGLPALTNTSNVTAIRALAGSTNTNHPFSGQFNVIDDNSTTFTIVVSNGIIVSATEY